MTEAAKKWALFEIAFTSQRTYDNPLQDGALIVTFLSEQGKVFRVAGFWDGGNCWRVRFMPSETGLWRYATECTDPRDRGLHGRTGTFTCTEADGDDRFQKHGAVHVSSDGQYLAHADGAPYFFLADTAWNGPLLSTDDEWRSYLDTRVRQRFSAVQWVATQWIASPTGDRFGELPYVGHERIAVNPAVFQRLDAKLQQMNAAGLLGVVVLLWAAEWGKLETMRVNPGLTLPEDQCVLLARYMIARWGAHHVMWCLAGDGEYRGAKADRWVRIGRAVFGREAHAPVMLHPNGMAWHADEFRNEPWMNIVAYQGCHFGDDNALNWAVHGPPASEWHTSPPRPILNLEPPYENHVDLSDHSRRFCADDVRRAMYWSLLVSPTAGVTYGGHGVWGWNDGTAPAIAHEEFGVPQRWQDALLMPAAEQIQHMDQFFNSIAWWTLKPEPGMVVHQPGDTNIARFIAASRSENGDLALVYIPSDSQVTLDLSALKPTLRAKWLNPRTGERIETTHSQGEFTTPSAGDWLLLLS